MAMLVLTRRGYEELRAIVGSIPSPLWVGAGVLDEREVAEARAAGIELTVFETPINPLDAAAVESAIETVGRHHSGDTIWVERQVEREYDV